MNTLKSFKIEDLLDLTAAFGRVAASFGDFAGHFFTWAGAAIWSILEIIFEVVSPAALGYIKKTGAAFKNILKNPMRFVGNLVKAAKLGLTNFADNIVEHLKAGLIDWLTGSLPGVYIPKALSLGELGKFALSVLGISWAQIRGKIVKALGAAGETIMKGLETTYDVVIALVKGGAAAVWELIKEKLTDLKDHGAAGDHRFRGRHDRQEGDPEAGGDVHPGRRVHLGDHLDLRHDHGVRGEALQDRGGGDGVRRLDRRDRAGADRGRGEEGGEHAGRAAVAGDQLPGRVRWAWARSPTRSRR